MKSAVRLTSSYAPAAKSLKMSCCETVSVDPKVTSLFLMVMLSKAKPSRPVSWDDPAGPTEPIRPLRKRKRMSMTCPA